MPKPLPVDRFRALFAEVEALMRSAWFDKQWDKYERALDALDKIAALMVKPTKTIEVDVASPDGMYFSAAHVTERKPGISVVEVPPQLLRYLCEDLRFLTLHNLYSDHPDPKLRESYAKPVYEVALRCADMLAALGAKHVQAHVSQFVRYCDMVGEYAALHFDRPKELTAALAYIERGMKHVEHECSDDKAYIRNAAARLLRKLGRRDEAFTLVRDTLEDNPEYAAFKELPQDPEYRAWLAADEAEPQTFEDQTFSAIGRISTGAFAGVWKVLDAKRNVRIEIDLTGEPCRGRKQWRHHLEDALIARYVPKLAIPEVEAAAKIKWQKFEGADKRFPLFLKALASREPILVARASDEIGMATDCQQGSVGEATPAALPFFVSLLEGESADQTGRAWILMILDSIAGTVAYRDDAFRADATFRGVEKELKKLVPRLKKLAASGPTRERARVKAILKTIQSPS